jgi:hypothetical protein
LQNIRIVLPPTNKALYKLFAEKRALVENRIADCKNWGAYKYQLRMKIDWSKNILKIHNQNWTIVNFL